jgi:hypothetical protein
VKDLEAARRDIEAIVADGMRAQDELNAMRNSGLSAAMEDEFRADLQARIEKDADRCRRELMSLIDFPPRHVRHFELLKRFWDDGSYERSVFLMTKFPEPCESPKAAELQRVIDAVAQSTTTAGFVPRIARFPSNYHPGLWDNVELHLLGCRQGIAIVEDRYLPELNPNIAMEWGWMRGMGKPVLFLLEQEFDHFRADLGDLLKENFEWADPEPGVDAAVSGWLGRLERDAGLAAPHR